MIGNNILLGYDRSNIILTKPGNVKERLVDQITSPDVAEQYEDSVSALLGYIKAMNTNIEMRRFFGKFAENIGEAENLTETIGAYTLDLLSKGEITPEQELEIREILQGIFAKTAMPESFSVATNLSYIQTMGNVISSITQLQDLGWSLADNGFFGTGKGLLKTIFRNKNRVTAEDLGLNDLMEELSKKGFTGTLLEKIFKYSGISTIDKLTLETYATGRFEEYKKLANEDKLPKFFEQKLQNVFGKEWEQKLEDLKKGELNETMKRIVLDDVMDIRPISSVNKSEAFNKAGAGKVFYTLKQYTLKQLDAYRKRVYIEIADGIKNKDKDQVLRGLKKFVMTALYLTAMGMGADELKDWILGRSTTMSDLVTNNIIKQIGINSYTLDTVSREGIGSAVLKTFVPVIFTAPFTVVDNIVQGKAVKSIPVIGRILYERTGARALSNKDTAIKQVKDEVKNSPAVQNAFEAAKEAGFGTDEANDIVDQLSDEEYDGYKALKSAYLTQQTKELKPKIYPVLEKAAKLGFGTDEADALVNALTDDEYRVYKNLKEKYYPKADDVTDESSSTGETKVDGISYGKEMSEQNFIEKIVTYAEALSQDPIDVFDKVFSKDTIRKSENGTLIVDRINYLGKGGSAEIKKERGAEPGMKLDHTIPLELGGTNDEDNLKLISEEEWKNNTPVENFLGLKIREKKINGRQARKLIKAFQKQREDFRTSQARSGKLIRREVAFIGKIKAL
jgi:hypothetical protein